MLLLALYFVQRFILQTNLRKKKDTKMDKKTLSTPIPPRDICKWHNLPTVTVYMFALYFSPTFNLPFGGETGDRPATRWALCAWDQYRLQGVARKTCSDTQCKGCQLSSTEKHGGGGIHGRIWVFSWSFFGEFFLGGRFVVLKKVGFYWEC